MDIPSYLIGAIKGAGSAGVKYVVVQTLPSTGEEGTIYLVPKSTSKTNNVYDEYMYINEEWELIGDTEIDLSNYQTLLSTTNKLNADYIDDTNTTNKLTNATEKSTWNGKQDTLVSGTNIKTINNESILGSGNLDIGGGDTDSLKLYEMNCYNPTAEEKATMDEICDLIDNGEKNILIYNTATATQGASKWLLYSHTSYGQYFFLVLGIDTTENSMYPTSYGYTYKEVNNYYIKYIKSSQQFSNSQNGAVFKYLETNRNYSTAYIPQYDGSPATKKYVDDAVAGAGGGAKYKLVMTDNDYAELSNFNTNENKAIFQEIFDNISNISPSDIYIYGTKKIYNVKEIRATSSQLRLILEDLSDNSGSDPMYGVSYNQIIKNELYANFSNDTLTGDILKYTSRGYIIYERNTIIGKNNTTAFTPTGDYNPSTKLYTDKTHYENMAGYDATKTQVLKNINGTLTWVDE